MLTENKQCRFCGTYLKPGQPHTALEPIPHETYEMLIAFETDAQTRAKDGSHGPFTPR